MKIITTYYGPTSVSHSLKCNLSDDLELDYLLVGRCNVLDVYAILPDGLLLQCSQPLWGSLTSLHAVYSKALSRDTIVISLDHPEPKVVFLQLDYEQTSVPKLVTTKVVSLAEKLARPAEILNGLVVDHKGHFLLAFAYSGRVKVIMLKNGDYDRDFDVSIRELNVLAACVLHTGQTRNPVIAFLYKDHQSHVNLVSHDLLMKDNELSPAHSPVSPDVSPLDEAYSLIPVPPQQGGIWASDGGILLLGLTSISFYALSLKPKRRDDSSRSTRTVGSSRNPDAQIDWQFSEITAWTEVDEKGTRFLMGDSFGRLCLLSLDLKGKNLNCMLLGEISSPTSLTILPSQFVFVGSHFGDSQLIEISKTENTSSNSFVEIVEQMENIAPVMDATVVENNGEDTVVTCSGGRNTGSLKIIRKGAHFIVEKVIESIPALTGMWPLKRTFDDANDSFLLLSTPTSTFVAELPNDLDSFSVLPIIQHDVIRELKRDTQTICASNVLLRQLTNGRCEYHHGPSVVQVTPHSVTMVDMSMGQIESSWKPPAGHVIVLADFSKSQLCVALSGGLVVLLVFEEGGVLEVNQKRFTDESNKCLEISTLAIKPAIANDSSNYIVVGFFSNEIGIYTLPNFDLKSSVQLSYLPRSLCLYGFSSNVPHLFVGQANGSVVSYPFRKGIVNATDAKEMTLGNLPVALSRSDGDDAILACGSRSVLITWSSVQHQLSHSHVMLKDVLDSSSVAIGSQLIVLHLDRKLIFGRVKDMNKLHVQTVPMGPKTPLKLAYHSRLEAFGVCCLPSQPVEEHSHDDLRCTFELVKNVNLSRKTILNFQQHEEPTALIALKGRKETDAALFAVGTVFYEVTETEPSRGRLIIVACHEIETGPSETRFEARIAAEIITDGCVYAIAETDDKLAVAINTGVQLFEFLDMSTPDGGLGLTKLSEWNHNYLVNSLVMQDDLIVVGDAVTSIAVLKIMKNKLQTVVRDYKALWPSAVEFFGRNSLIGVTNDNNVFSFEIHPETKRPEQDGLYYLGENVNKFASGNLKTGMDSAKFLHRQLLFTSTGRIASISNIQKQSDALMLSALQRNMSLVLPGPESSSHSSYRAPSNNRGRSDAQPESFGFLDGDYLLHLFNTDKTSPDYQRILKGSNAAEQLDEPQTMNLLKEFRESL